jgi:hypothetical protein
MKPITLCRWLQNKGFLFEHGDTGEGDSKEDLVDRYSTPCWCTKTHDGIGPDDAIVDVGVCQKGRECFEPEVDI